MKVLLSLAAVVCFAAITLAQTPDRASKKDTVNATDGAWTVVCMDKNGKSLSKDCVNALVTSGEVTQAEVDRRKNGH